LLVNADLAVGRTAERRIKYNRRLGTSRYGNTKRINTDNALGPPQGAIVGSALVVTQPIISAASACIAK
jgi:hypothetical protein